MDYLGQKRYMPLCEVTEQRLLSAVEEALADGEDNASSVEQLRRLAAENEAAARRLLEETDE